MFDISLNEATRLYTTIPTLVLREIFLAMAKPVHKLFSRQSIKWILSAVFLISAITFAS